MMWFLWTLIIAGSVVIDRVTKYLTVAYLKPVGDVPLIDGWLHLSYVENTGAAFGMLKDQRVLFLVASTIGILAMLALLVYKGKSISVLGTVSLCMIIGGGIGNQIDRIVQGYVVDMIYVKIIDFAVFNVADAFVCVGVGLLVISLFTLDRGLLEDRSEKAKAIPASSADDVVVQDGAAQDSLENGGNQPEGKTPGEDFCARQDGTEQEEAEHD